MVVGGGGGGSWGQAVSKKNFFRPLRASIWSKNKGGPPGPNLNPNPKNKGGTPRAPPLDPPLQLNLERRAL